MSGFKRIACLGDIHSPYFHPDLPKFVQAIEKKYKPDKWVQIGDETDQHAISYHDHDPDLASHGLELDAVIKKFQWLYKLVPEMELLDSNHGSLVARKGKTHGLSKRVFRPTREIIEAPKGWNWHPELRLKMSNGERVLFHHGKSAVPGMLAKSEGINTVQGHHHERFQIFYIQRENKLLWDCHTGCLINQKSLAFAYNKCNLFRPVIGSIIIIDGHPRLLPMILNKSGRWTGDML